MARRRVRDSEKDINGKLSFDRVADSVIDTEVEDFIPETYLPYSASVILDRAIPEEDGLLPVQRRILWAMYVNHMFPTSGFSKVLSIIGDVAKYHPHGDASIGSSIVRMAQPFSLRVPLVQGMGNFASVPGDDASAPRYISARMSKAAMECVEEVKFNAVEMGKNYSGKLDEPSLLPVRFPVSIVNGSQGIAVGFATYMAQHNPAEAMKVARLLLKEPNASMKRIMHLMPGPDFKTGGIVLGTQGIKDYYETGRGRLLIRSKYTVEQGKGGKTTLKFYEIPPYISVDQCREAINDIAVTEEYKDSKDKAKAKKYRTMAAARKALNGISRAVDLTDFETGNGVDFEVELKAAANPKAIVMALFKYTPLQSSFSVNNTVIYEGRPQTVGIRELFKQFLDLRRRCVKNVNQSKKASAEHRMKLIDGLLAILLDIDKAISIIRRSKDEDTAKTNLKREFKLDDEQAEYVLGLPLRRLTRQDSVKLKQERKTLADNLRIYNGILKDPKKLDDEVDRLLAETAKIIGDKRYMEILDASDEEIAAMDKDMKRSAKMEEKDVPCVVTVSDDGRHMKRIIGADADRAHHRIILGTSNLRRVISIGADGVGYAVRASSIIDGKNIPIGDVFGMPKGMDTAGIINDGTPVLTVSSDGYVKVTAEKFNDKWTSHPMQSLKAPDASIVSAIPLPDKDSKQYERTEVLLVSSKGKVIRFPLGDVNPTGFGAGGVAGMKLKDGDSVAAAAISDTPRKDYLATRTLATVKGTPVSQIPLQKRSGAGVILQRLAKGDMVADAIVNGLMTAGRKTQTPPMSKRDGLAAPLPAKSRLVVS